ncbi:MAG TPA: GNAT family N-acetyltransferase [Candidatus Dormibacteraeota bacterium]|nr:GNAT family N-acetyltransferase [Candidatus Dormibacteraeota bacterium]
MRPGRPEDLEPLIDLWRREVTAGRQDMVPDEGRMRRILSRFDWEARSRMVEDSGRLEGAVLLMSRPSPDGVIASMYVAGPPSLTSALARWGLQLSRAAGATVTQTFMARGHGDGLRDAGMTAVRPWWRMDRSLELGLPRPSPVSGYSLIDGDSSPPLSWADIFNRAFADHWRFAPRNEEEVAGGKPPELCLMALTAPGREPVAIAFAEVDTYPDDARPQPVGLISSVGTLPEHRRRGLARWLVIELMHRVKLAGARTASLYVDGMNATHAADLYRKLGFEVAFEAEVWEATHP